MKKTMILSLLVVGLFASCEERKHYPQFYPKPQVQKEEKKPALSREEMDRRARANVEALIGPESRRRVEEMKRQYLAQQEEEQRRIDLEIRREVELQKIARESRQMEVEKKISEDARRSWEESLRWMEQERQRQHELEMIREANRGGYYR